MANLQYVKKNRIRTELTSKKAAARQTVLYYGIPFGVALSAILELCGLAGGMLLVWPGLAACYAIAPTIVHSEIEERGACGEEYVLKVLSTLPDEYIVFNEVKLQPPHDGRPWEIDYVVVGPNGVFIIEVKDYHGSLIGKHDDQEWRLIKVGRGGTVYMRTVKNPVKQVKRYIWLLSEKLRALEAETWLTGVVALSRNNDLKHVEGGNTEIVKGNELAEFFHTHQSTKRLDKNVVESLISICASGI